MPKKIQWLITISIFCLCVTGSVSFTYSLVEKIRNKKCLDFQSIVRMSVNDGEVLIECLMRNPDIREVYEAVIGKQAAKQIKKEGLSFEK